MCRLTVFLASLVISCVALVGCAEVGIQQNRTEAQQANASCPFWSEKMLQGMIAGGAIGGVTAAATSKHRSASDILTGIFAGGAAGGAIGKILDKKDCDAAQSAMQRMATARAGTVVAWRNPETGNSGTFVAKGTPQQNQRGQLCRPFEQTVMLNDGKSVQKEGTTCREANGDWYPVT